MAAKRDRDKLGGGTPPTKKTKEKDKTGEPTLCVSCSKSADKDSIECDLCHEWEHRDCAGISKDEYKILGKSSSKIKFFCSKCSPKVDTILEASEATVEVQDPLEVRLKSIESQVAKLVEYHQLHLPEDCNPGETDERVPCGERMELSASSTNIPLTKKNVDISSALSSALAEEKERSKRQLNLIIHNLDEPSSENSQVRKESDTKKVVEIFKHLGVQTTVNNAIRLGKKGDKNRLLKVSVNSDKEKAAILRSCTRLRNDSTPSHFRKVYITPDLTPQQQAQNKALRSRLAEMNQQEKLYRIKNGVIVRREN